MQLTESNRKHLPTYTTYILLALL